ncbi:type II secretion system F family protein [Streptomyces gamaensis]|uniref:Type II secretion system F family protein n=1 Tax=Streptomyces gamaensis TaxID=1763542 RepID=A0ABW0Z3Z5_9ACTN
MIEGFVHSLWVMLLLGLAPLFVMMLASEERRERATRRRLRSMFAAEAAAGPPRGVALRRFWEERGPSAREVLSAVAVLGAGAVLVGGVVGVLVGAVAAYGVRWWLRRARNSAGAAPDEPARAVERQLPLAADLMAACLAAGAGPGEAAEVVGGSLGGPVGERLARAAAEVRLGGDPAAAWNRLGRLTGARGLARCLARAQATGVPAVEPVSLLAGRLRAERGRSAGIRARRAGVLATVPLGVCFLPAFLALGVVPVVIGLAKVLMAGG